MLSCVQSIMRLVDICHGREKQIADKPNVQDASWNKVGSSYLYRGFQTVDEGSAIVFRGFHITVNLYIRE